MEIVNIDSVIELEVAGVPMNLLLSTHPVNNAMP